MGLGPSAPYHLTPSDQLSQVLEGACQVAKTPLENHPRGSKIEAGGEYLRPSHYAIYSSLILTISQISSLLCEKRLFHAQGNTGPCQANPVLGEGSERGAEYGLPVRAQVSGLPLSSRKMARIC